MTLARPVDDFLGEAERSQRGPGWPCASCPGLEPFDDPRELMQHRLALHGDQPEQEVVRVASEFACRYGCGWEASDDQIRRGQGARARGGHERGNHGRLYGDRDLVARDARGGSSVQPEPEATSLRERIERANPPITLGGGAPAEENHLAPDPAEPGIGLPAPAESPVPQDMVAPSLAEAVNRVTRQLAGDGRPILVVITPTQDELLQAAAFLRGISLEQIVSEAIEGCAAELRSDDRVTDAIALRRQFRQRRAITR
jgi:hypothetical protein